MKYEMPTVVTNGETSDLVLNLTNTGSETVMINDIEPDESFGGSLVGEFRGSVGV